MPAHAKIVPIVGTKNIDLMDHSYAVRIGIRCKKIGGSIVVWHAVPGGLPIEN